jgi:3-hydroxymyristoyl/3-hydroxydecanoyl-(acyl carrier protein) dehydratase
MDLSKQSQDQPQDQGELRSPQDVIPHRPPFLFLDHIVCCEEWRVIGRYRFSSADPMFSGHFPQRPLVPGVLLIEGAAQTLAYWALRQRPEHWVLLTGVDRAKWTSPVTPEQDLEYQVEITRAKMGLVIAQTRVLCEGQVAMTAQIKGYLQARQEDDLPHK